MEGVLNVKNYIHNASTTPGGSDLPLLLNDNVFVSGNIDINGDINITSSTAGYYLNGIPLQTGFWNQSGSNIYYDSGNVGIGLSGPSEKLHISEGGIRLSFNTSAGTGLVFDMGAANVAGLIHINKNGQNRLKFGSTGNNGQDNFVIFRYADNGSFLGAALTISRLNGYATFGGAVESTSGGFKFPDGTTQTTAGGSKRVVGRTSIAYDGRGVGGYDGGDAKCVADFGVGARMATAADFANGRPSVSGWYSSFLSYSTSLAPGAIYDCGGWTTRLSGALGPWWPANGFGPSFRGCFDLQRILCSQ